MRIHSLILTASLLCTGTAGAAPIAEAPLADFITYMQRTHDFDEQALRELFADIERSDRIIDLMTRPAEKVKPWWEYRQLFISEKRINDGLAFWREHATTLERAERKYGVPPEVIVAIIGVETSYGRITGGFRVIEALATLAFHYPGGNQSRSDFFRAQLEHVLLLAREEGFDALELQGSYAGAMGMPQFMPENFRKLAVDFDHDGVRDIWGNPADAIGSVANYLHHHGWQRAGPVVARAQVNDAAAAASFAQTSLPPSHRLSNLVAAGIEPAAGRSSGDEEVALYELEARHGSEYWIGFTNFYVISRYNPRIKYAMAVAHLAEDIRVRRQGSGS
ncbi:MAG: lytic murein transglycosylase B [Gammaproteobacteria bacterium]